MINYRDKKTGKFIKHKTANARTKRGKESTFKVVDITYKWERLLEKRQSELIRLADLEFNVDYSDDEQWDRFDLDEDETSG